MRFDHWTFSFRRWPAPFAICALVVGAALPADAELLTNGAAVPPDAAVVDFSQFVSSGRISFQSGDPAYPLDDFAEETVLLRPMSGTSTVALLLGNHTPPEHPDNSFYLGANGAWGPGRGGFLGIGGGNGAIVTARIEFATGPVAGVVGLFNYSPDFPPLVIAALDDSESVLEQHTINVAAPISTAGLDDVGEFRGIRRAQDEIFAIELTAPFAVFDDLRFWRNVPEPAASVLWAPWALACSGTARGERRRPERAARIRHRVVIPRTTNRVAGVEAKRIPLRAVQVDLSEERLLVGLEVSTPQMPFAQANRDHDPTSRRVDRALPLWYAKPLIFPRRRSSPTPPGAAARWSPPPYA